MKSLLNSEYLKNILTLVSGSAIAQGILLGGSLVLARLYTPADFGVFAVFTAVGTILGMIASGRLEIAIMLPEEESEAIDVFKLCLFTAFSFTVFILFSFFLFSSIEAVQESLLFRYRYWLLATVFLQATVQSSTGLLNRSKNYKGITRSRLFGSLGIAGFSIWFGLLNFGAFGLILGKIIGQTVEAMFLFYSVNFFWSEKINGVKKNFSKKYLALFSRYSAFAKFSTIEGLLNNVFKQIPVFALSTFFNSTVTGHFSFAQKIIGAPTGMLGNSIGKVFFQKAVEYNRKKDNSLRRFFKQNLRTLTMIILPVSLIVILFSPSVFSFIFGEEWRVSGQYAAWLMPFIAVIFTKAPLSCIIDIKNKLKTNLLFEVGFLLITCIAFYIAFAKNDEMIGIQIFSLGNAALGLLQLTWFYSLTKE